MKEMLRSKRAQFYILAAILLVGYVMTIAPAAIKPKKPISTFKSLHQNYMDESAKAINNAVYYDSNVSELLMNFSDSFSAYAKTRDPNFRLVYALLYRDRIYMKNYLDETINATANTTLVGLGGNSYTDTAAAGSLALNVSNLIYTLRFDKPVQLRAFFRTKSGEEASVYAYG